MVNSCGQRRCRTLYEKYLEFAPQSAAAWQQFARFELELSEVDRARAIYELAIAQPVLDMPELLWKSYIDLEVEQVRGEGGGERVLVWSGGRLGDDKAWGWEGRGTRGKGRERMRGGRK
jgi:hypothetical protein